MSFALKNSHKPVKNSKAASQAISIRKPIEFSIPVMPEDKVTYINQNGEKIEDTVKEIHIEVTKEHTSALFICKSLRFL